jgi:uncharacterized cupredoxin-like copper-binding protein
MKTMIQLERRILLVLATVVFAALTSAMAASARVAGTTAASTITIRVKAREFRFTLSARSAPRGRVTFVVKNAGVAIHDFKINGKKTAGIDGGKTAKLTVNFTKAGKYRYRCTFDGHAAAGMRGVFTIR